MGSSENIIKKRQELNGIKMLELIIIRITRYRFDVHDLARNCHFLAKNDPIQTDNVLDYKRKLTMKLF